MGRLFHFTLPSGKERQGVSERKLTLVGGSVGGPHKKLQRTYFILNPATNLVKVGKGTDPVRRMQNLQTSIPDARLVLLHVINENVEAEMHRRLAHLRVSPRSEWFTYSPALKDLIKRLRGEK